jgi:hypothetical protein
MTEARQIMRRLDICESCRATVLNLLDQRIRRMLAVCETEEDKDHERACAFHLMEIMNILEGRYTCGVYDDFGRPARIDGPLFSQPQGSDER